jgi:CRISPR/Cas system-associated exonuclease Cas4 (RecB family)
LDELIEETAADDVSIDEQVFLKHAKKAQANHTRKLHIKQTIQQSKLAAKSEVKSKAQAHATHKPKTTSKVRARGNTQAKVRARARASSSSSTKATTKLHDVAIEADMKTLFSDTQMGCSSWICSCSSTW